jgi:hypothetical protein
VATSEASKQLPYAFRVDDHAEPLIELQRLYNKSLERFQPFVSALAGRHDPVGIIDRMQIEASVVQFHAQLAARRTKTEIR